MDRTSFLAAMAALAACPILRPPLAAKRVETYIFHRSGNHMSGDWARQLISALNGKARFVKHEFMSTRRGCTTSVTLKIEVA